MCEAPATTTEHAPPKCFFPEFKDVGIDVRKQLITVPACDDHNLRRSQDDEYSMLVVVAHFETNGLARSQFQTKCIRSLRRGRGPLPGLVRSAVETSVGGRRTGAIDISRERFDRVMDHTCRALYWHNTHRRLHQPLVIWSPIFRAESFDAFPPYAEMAFGARQLLRDAPRQGENPKAFWYQWREGRDSVLFRLHYYEGASVYAGTIPLKVERAGVGRIAP